MSSEKSYSFWPLLKKVSRSFYLSLAFLPSETAKPVGLAYALARAADTLVDTPLLSPEERLSGLHLFQKVVQDLSHQSHSGALQELQEVILHNLLRVLRPGHFSGEEELLISLPHLFQDFRQLAPSVRSEMENVLVTIFSGMRRDLERFPPTSSQVHALSTWEELDEYCYFVAGVVGKFWTNIHALLRPGLENFATEETLWHAERFGKALQLTNILRDIPSDLRRGRCYLPEEELRQLGLSPQELLRPCRARRALPLYRSLLEKTREYYRSALHYLQTIPSHEWALRFSSALPVAIGLRTVRLLAQTPNPFLLHAPPRKIRRSEVYRLIAQLLQFFLHPALEATFWKRLYHYAHQEATDSLHWVP